MEANVKTDGKFVPLYERVLMEQVVEEKTDGGLFIPKTSQEKEAERWKILAVGPGKYDPEKDDYLRMHVGVGDVVFVNPYLGMRVKIGRGKQYLVQREDEILGKEVQTGMEAVEGGSGG